MKFNADIPIQCSECDMLGRKNFSEYLAKAIN